jgi:uncharacterized protein YbjT (DUF2867 family)
MRNQKAARVIAVAGATGLQGGAVARRLLSAGWAVRALTRRPDSATAAGLAAAGATVVRADLEDVASLRAACRGVHGVFSVQNFWEHGYEREVAQGRNLAEAAKAERVRHFVYASVGGAERTAGLGITHFDSKAAIERHVVQLGITWTIIRPVTFFENFTAPVSAQRIVHDGMVIFPFPGNRPFQLVAVEDEADFVAAAFAAPERFGGQAIELASDACRLDDLAAEIGRTIRRPIQFVEMPMDVFEALTAEMERSGQTPTTKIGPSLVAQFTWNRSTPSGGWNAGIPHLRSIMPSLRRMPDWVRSVDWSLGSTS